MRPEYLRDIGLGINVCSESFFKAFVVVGMLKQSMYLKLSKSLFKMLTLWVVLSSGVPTCIASSYSSALVLTAALQVFYFAISFESVREGEI